MHNYFHPSNISVTILLQYCEVCCNISPKENAEQWAGVKNRTQNVK